MTAAIEAERAIGRELLNRLRDTVYDVTAVRAVFAEFGITQERAFAAMRAARR